MSARFSSECSMACPPSTPISEAIFPWPVILSISAAVAANSRIRDASPPACGSDRSVPGRLRGPLRFSCNREKHRRPRPGHPHLPLRNLGISVWSSGWWIVQVEIRLVRPSPFLRILSAISLCPSMTRAFPVDPERSSVSIIFPFREHCCSPFKCPISGRYYSG